MEDIMQRATKRMKTFHTQTQELLVSSIWSPDLAKRFSAVLDLYALVNINTVLPNEIFVQIFEYLRISDFGNALCVCTVSITSKYLASTYVIIIFRNGMHTDMMRKYGEACLHQHTFSPL